eukprot:434216-Pyramimonas_sp.AAC.1
MDDKVFGPKRNNCTKYRKGLPSADRAGFWRNANFSNYTVGFPAQEQRSARGARPKPPTFYSSNSLFTTLFATVAASDALPASRSLRSTLYLHY